MQKFDVIILGGGLASLTLARQIKLNRTETSILILEKRMSAAATAAHKVGESTVELGTHYLREFLGLKDYLDQTHLHKHGLRFLFPCSENKAIDQRSEYGAKNELFVPSHQIDRGIFENDLIQRNIQDGIVVELGAGVVDVDLQEEDHLVTYEKDGATIQASGKWVVDGTGRFGFLKRKLGLKKDVEHHINSSWFRVKGEIDIADWSDDAHWKSKINPGLRRLGTVHLMGEGYWLWLIPLSSGNTSIGIVADNKLHPFAGINTLKKAMKWIEEHEPQCFEKIASLKVLDFNALPKYSYNCGKFYSSDRWAVIGEAGAFLDPFYSPGTDFISISNCWTSDLILRSLEGEDIFTRSIIYDQVHSRLFENWIPIYLNKYKMFGNAQLMTVKITWDFAVYWAIPSLIFTNRGYTNMNLLKVLFTGRNSFGERFQKLNANAQQLFEDWFEQNTPNAVSGKYFDPMDVPHMLDFQKGIENIFETDEELIEQLETNLKTLEKMFASIYRKVYSLVYGADFVGEVDPYTFKLTNETKSESERSSKTSAYEVLFY